MNIKGPLVTTPARHTPETTTGVAREATDAVGTIGTVRRWASTGRAHARGKVVVLHAFDAANRGDRMLVEETLALLRRAGVADRRLHLVALNGPSFASVAPTLHYPGAGSGAWERLAGLASEGGMALGGMLAPPMLSHSRVGQLTKDASLIVGVGGGYLRAPGGYQSFLTVAKHVPQLALASASEAPSVYLPQSVGPLTGPGGRVVRRYLRGLSWLALRDDRSVNEVGLHQRVARVPDLAVLALARAMADGLRPRRGRRAVVLARRLPAGARYETRLRALSRLPDVTWAHHCVAGGQDDRSFYRAMGLDAPGSSVDALAQGDVGVVISVRLHGALQAVLSGVPAIHLAYERKGYGGYDDLGVCEWVHDAWSFSPDQVIRQAADLIADPSPFWSAIAERTPALLEQDESLVERLRRAL